MPSEATIREYAERFSDPKKAMFSLFSIAGLARELGLSEDQVLSHIEDICAIAAPYVGSESIDVLRVIDRRYGEAVEEPNSKLQVFAKRGIIEDPVRSFKNRTYKFFRERGERLTIKGIDTTAEDALVECDVFAERSTGSRRRGKVKYC